MRARIDDLAQLVTDFAAQHKKHAADLQAQLQQHGAGLTRIQQHIEKTREWNGPSREGAPRRWRSTAS